MVTTSVPPNSCKGQDCQIASASQLVSHNSLAANLQRTSNEVSRSGSVTNLWGTVTLRVHKRLSQPNATQSGQRAPLRPTIRSPIMSFQDFKRTLALESVPVSSITREHLKTCGVIRLPSLKSLQVEAEDLCLLDSFCTQSASEASCMMWKALVFNMQNYDSKFCGVLYVLLS